MSEFEVKNITDRSGTGSPDFSQGFKVAGTLDTNLSPLRTEGDNTPVSPSNGDTFFNTVTNTYDIYVNNEWKRLLG